MSRAFFIKIVTFHERDIYLFRRHDFQWAWLLSKRPFATFNARDFRISEFSKCPVFVEGNLPIDIFTIYAQAERNR